MVALPDARHQKTGKVAALFVLWWGPCSLFWDSAINSNYYVDLVSGTFNSGPEGPRYVRMCGWWVRMTRALMELANILQHQTAVFSSGGEDGYVHL
jgi:hypothetical protein